MVASPPIRPISAAALSDTCMWDPNATVTEAPTAMATTSAPMKPDHVLLGENRGQSLGPPTIFPTAKAPMSAAHVTASNNMVQARPSCGPSRTQVRARQGAPR